MMTFKSKMLALTKSTLRLVGVEASYAKRALTEENILRFLFRRHKLNFILDVGANSGQYGRLVRRCGYQGRIVSFEPLSTAHKKLAESAAKDPSWTVADRGALGAKPCRSTIHVSQNSVSSSLLPIKARHVDAAPQSAFVAVEDVQIIRLDDCIQKYLGAAGGGLLKIDTQGYEMEVIRGGRQALCDRIDIVQTELSLTELYAGQPLMLDICNALKENGFSLRHLIPGFRDPIHGALLQLDGIFCKHSVNESDPFAD